MSEELKAYCNYYEDECRNCKPEADDVRVLRERLREAEAQRDTAQALAELMATERNAALESAERSEADDARVLRGRIGQLESRVRELESNVTDLIDLKVKALERAETSEALVEAATNFIITGPKGIYVVQRLLWPDGFFWAVYDSPIPSALTVPKLDRDTAIAEARKRAGLT